MKQRLIRMMGVEKHGEAEKQLVASSVKHGGGNVMVWACMASSETGLLCLLMISLLIEAVR